YKPLDSLIYLDIIFGDYLINNIFDINTIILLFEQIYKVCKPLKYFKIKFASKRNKFKLSTNINTTFNNNNYILDKIIRIPNNIEYLCIDNFLQNIKLDISQCNKLIGFYIYHNNTTTNTLNHLCSNIKWNNNLIYCYVRHSNYQNSNNNYI